ncbi:MAG TPA: cell envelope integrity protein CreD [Catalimonadaceae bacterium]|jgi:inner membrane protein|nr:cell envelope integrity protein CreD [Catalimonadaceae bacterium]
MAEEKSLIERLGSWIRHSTSLKLLVIGILILILLIPGGMVNELIRERQNLRDQTVDEIAGKWGSPQTIAGPIISIPYKKRSKLADGKVEETTEFAHFLPSNLTIKGKLEPEKRNRGIFVVMLYKALLNVEGDFEPLDYQKLNVPMEDLQLDKAMVTFGLSDLKGVNQTIKMNWNEANLEMSPGLPVHDLISSGVSAPIQLLAGKAVTRFSFQLDLNGSQSIRFCPFAKSNQIELSSSWGSPSFMGSFLPRKKEISATGFTANWQVLHLNRNYPQCGVGNFIPEVPQTEAFNSQKSVEEDRYSSFGVRLYLPVDEYQQTTRSAKYASMFIFLTFLCFFFVEVLNGKRIHPLQYLLVGFAVVLFYVLLLSLSEHIPFVSAYWLAASLIAALVTFYSWNMLQNKRLTAVVGFVFMVLYGFFYSLLQLEDFALLVGSFGLLAILATVMYLTRNINWYAIGEAEKE